MCARFLCLLTTKCVRREVNLRRFTSMGILIWLSMFIRFVMSLLHHLSAFELTVDSTMIFQSILQSHYAMFSIQIASSLFLLPLTKICPHLYIYMLNTCTNRSIIFGILCAQRAVSKYLVGSFYCFICYCTRTLRKHAANVTYPRRLYRHWHVTNDVLCVFLICAIDTHNTTFASLLALSFYVSFSSSVLFFVRHANLMA
jgi:hypothetical protein